jgi:hypothetical protein
MKESNDKILLNLVQKYIDLFKPKRTLFLDYSDFVIFEGLSKSTTKTLFRGQSISSDEEKFDLIIGNLPLGMPKIEWIDKDREINIKTRANWIDLFKSSFLLNDSGYGIYIVEPIQRSEEWLRFQEQLKKKEFFINAIFNTPQGILQPQTFLQLNLVIISRIDNPQLFIAELNDLESLETIINNFKDLFESGSLDTGVLINENDFRGFSQYKIIREINALEIQYKSYKKYQLKEVALEIILGAVKNNFKNRPNSIYLPKIGTSPVVSRLKDLKIKQQNYFQIVLDEGIVKNEYLESFFKSALGKITLKTLMRGSIIPHINKRDLMEAYVSIPNFKEQEILIATAKKLAHLREKVDIFDKEIALNPKSAQSIQDKLNNMLSALDELTEADKIRAIVRTGESKTIEFKQTLSVDVKTDKREKYIEKMVLKTLVAFLNTDGGISLVGVSNDKNIIGIQREIQKYYKNDDKFLLHLKNLIKTSIGESFYPFIDYRLVDIESCKILQIECQSSNKPCYFESKDFYVRINPATDKLEGPKMVDYIQSHFKNK